jgi:hypothetical protein
VENRPEELFSIMEWVKDQIRAKLMAYLVSPK